MNPEQTEEIISQENQAAKYIDKYIYEDVEEPAESSDSSTENQEQERQVLKLKQESKEEVQQMYEKNGIAKETFNKIINDISDSKVAGLIKAGGKKLVKTYSSLMSFVSNYVNYSVVAILGLTGAAIFFAIVFILGSIWFFNLIDKKDNKLNERFKDNLNIDPKVANEMAEFYHKYLK